MSPHPHTKNDTYMNSCYRLDDFVKSIYNTTKQHQGMELALIDISGVFFNNCTVSKSFFISTRHPGSFPHCPDQRRTLAPVMLKKWKEHVL
jgi:hypothetical protein